jgi:hypothetical protein
MEKTYQDFLESKRHTTINYGIEPKYIPDFLFDYQKHVTEYAVKKGRCAVFLDTGLGKTLIELTIARNYVEHTNKNVLIITPLAVAFQFVKESERFGVIDIEYSKDGNYKSKVVVCNYERLDKFNPLDFDCVILDESSILKNFNGAIKSQVTAFLKKVKYRYLFTATPSPNDFIELGTSSEALGYMGYMEMLKTYFANNENNIRPQEIATKWYLKPHAKESFFDWVSGWSISMRKPSDLGFSDDGFDLPPLNLNYHAVKNTKNWVIDGQVMMFNNIARTMSEVKQEQQMTINERCEKAYELASKKDTSVYWCNFNKESEILSKLDPDAYEIKGSMNIDKKEELLIGFSEGSIKKLITKPKMTAFGLNWQHCNHTVYFPTWSYEQYYQSIRRFWRFGQKREVDVDLVYSDGQKRVIDTLLLKSEKASELFGKLNRAVNNEIKQTKEQFNKTLELPSFLGRK